MVFSDVLDNLISTSGSAFQSYESSQQSFTPLAPGTYVSPQGQVITANTPIATSGMSILTLLIFGAIFVFAFMSLRK